MLNTFITYFKRSFYSRPFVHTVIIFMQIIGFLCMFIAVGYICRGYTVFENSEEKNRTYHFDISAASNSEEGFIAKADQLFGVCGAYEKYQGAGTLKQDGVEYSFLFEEYDEEETLRRAGTVTLKRSKFGDRYSVGDRILLGDKYYTIYKFSELEEGVGHDIYFNMYSSLPTINCEFRWMYIILKYQPTYETSKEIVETIKSQFGENSIERQPQQLALLDQQQVKMQTGVSLIMILFLAVNCMLCFAYIYSQNTSTLKTFRLCGATNFDCRCIYMLEVFFYIAFSFAVSYILFEKFIKRIFVKMYPIFEKAYTAEGYREMLLYYLLISLVIMYIILVKFTKRSIVSCDDSEGL